MRVYKLRHIPTGMFFGPARGRRGEKTNLYEHGQVYSQKPSLSLLGFGRADYGILEDDVARMYVSWQKDLIDTKRSDWEVVEFELTEITND